MKATRTACLFRAICLMALGTVPTATLANPLVVRESKHDLSGPLRDVVIPAKSGGSQESPAAQPTRPPFSSSQPDSVGVRDSPWDEYF
jgi:hypothetical protein